MEITIGLLLLAGIIVFFNAPSQAPVSACTTQEYLAKRYPQFSEEDIRTLSYIGDDDKRSKFLGYLFKKYNS